MSDASFLALALALFAAAFCGTAALMVRQEHRAVCTTDTLAVRGDTTWMEVRCVRPR